MYEEQQYVVHTFDQSFSEMKEVPIAIYGLSNNTKRILEELPSYNIVGLLDPVRIGDCVYGKKVLKLEELSSLGCNTIVIVARYATLKIIYRRIQSYCRENQIRVFDISGNDLMVEKKNVGLPAEYGEITPKALARQIDEHDVISFDIFDTLLMRDVLYPRDIYEMLEEAEGYPMLAQKRAYAEDELNGEGNPTLVEVYDHLAKKENLPKQQVEAWQKKEIDLERKHLLPRKEVQELFSSAQRKGKTVVLTSDMYLPADILVTILQEKGYQISKEQIFVSCDWKCGKANGLFRVLCEKFPHQKILHIGDNWESDKKAAERYGLDAFFIPSAYQMLEDSAVSFLLNHVSSRKERDLIGRFIAHYFNSPFALTKTNGKLCIDNEYDLGRFFVAPLIQCFTVWMIQQTKQKGLEKILLGARDGYLLEKALECLEKKYPQEIPPHEYFYISRQAAVLAAIRTEDDILQAAAISFAGNLRMLLEKRFELQPEDIQEQQPGESDDAYLLRHKQEILTVAEQRRQAFLTYLHNVKIEPGHRYAFMDFVSSGTCQRYLQEIVDLDLTGLYVLKNESTQNQTMNIESAYGKSNVFVRDFAIIDVYFLLEKIVTSLEPTLQRFTADGTPVFMKEFRTPSQLEALKRIQQGVLDTFAEVESMDDLVSRLPLADDFLKALESSYSNVELDFVNHVELTDEFCNRKMEVAL